MTFDVLVSIESIAWSSCDSPWHGLAVDGPLCDSALSHSLYDNAFVTFSATLVYSLLTVERLLCAKLTSLDSCSHLHVLQPSHFITRFIIIIFLCTQISVICIIGASGWFVCLAACSPFLFLSVLWLASNLIYRATPWLGDTFLKLKDLLTELFRSSSHYFVCRKWWMDQDFA